MMRDINLGNKSASKHQIFMGEQPRKLAGRSGKSSTRHKKSQNYSVSHDMDDLTRDRHVYHRAATKNITREILRSSQF